MRRSSYARFVNKLRLAVESRSSPASLERVLEIYIDEDKLSSLAGVVERPFAEAEGSPHIAGSYAGLPVGWIGLGRAHFLGSPELSWFDDGDTVLLGCECGEWGCWPLTATVMVTPVTVTWSNFRTGHRDWDLSGLGPFTFDRAEYESALDAALPREG